MLGLATLGKFTLGQARTPRRSCDFNCPQECVLSHDVKLRSPFLTQAPLDGLAVFGACGPLPLNRRSFARRRLHPDPAPAHLHDLPGDGEAQARATLGLGKRTVDLVELIEDPTLLVEWYTGAGVGYRDGEMAVSRACGDG